MKITLIKDPKLEIQNAADGVWLYFGDYAAINLTTMSRENTLCSQKLGEWCEDAAKSAIFDQPSMARVLADKFIAGNEVKEAMNVELKAEIAQQGSKQERLDAREDRAGALFFTTGTIAHGVPMVTEIEIILNGKRMWFKPNAGGSMVGKFLLKVSYEDIVELVAPGQSSPRYVVTHPGSPPVPRYTITYRDADKSGEIAPSKYVVLSSGAILCAVVTSQA